MATAKELRAKLVLEATTKGGEKIEIIAEDLEKVADAGGEAQAVVDAIDIQAL